MDAASVDLRPSGPPLPSINFLKSDQSQRDPPPEHSHRPSHLSTAMVSPTFHFLGSVRTGSVGGQISSGTGPVGPPATAAQSSQPPFAPSASTTTASMFSFSAPHDITMMGHGGLISPPGSRRTSGDDKDQQTLPTATAPQRQSLPSIHEALRGDASSPFAVQPPSTTSPGGHSSYPQPHPSSAGASGPPDPFRKSFTAESLSGLPSASHPQHPPTPSSTTPFLGKPPQPLHAPQPPPNPPDQPATFSSAPANSQVSKLSLPLNTPSTSSSPNPTRPMPFPPYTPAHSHPQLPSPGYDPNSHPPPPGSTVPPPPPPPQATTPYGHPSQFASQYPFPPQPHQPPPGSSQTGPQPTGVPAPGFPPAPPVPFAGPPRPGTETYGANIKRHLESFDFESSLNEIADGSGQILDFAKHFRPPPPTPLGMPPHHRPSITLPTPADVDGLLQKSQRMQEALMRIRDFAVNQQALAEQEHEARFKGNGMFAGGAVGGSIGERYEYDMDSKGGSAGGYPPDAKKRRGRAAPPGRCHSCNRAETPEWRRGPDGARTLCNACGLHYAKLTRKMGGANKAAAGSSNLRPKSTGPSSPLQPRPNP